MRLITLNGVKLIVYQNGMILRYSEKNGNKITKGWNVLNHHILNSYKEVRFNKKHFKLHRILAYSFLSLDYDDKSCVVDHIDQNKQNNTLDNLRIISQQENGFNTKSKGYSWDKNAQKFSAQIHLNGIKIRLGMFETKEEAHDAYLKAKVKYHIIRPKI